MLPQVRELARRFPRDLVVLGVHSGKFAAERDPARLAAACARLGVAHAVVNDRQFRVWRQWAVRGWPTLAVVDARGYVVHQQAGEQRADALAAIVARARDAALADGTLDRAPRWLDAAHDAAHAAAHDALVGDAGGPLRFPEGIAVGAPDADGRRPCAVADTGHHRVLLGHLDAALERLVVARVVGRGVATRDVHGAPESSDPGPTRDAFAARADGPPDAATFDAPRGLAFGHDADGRPVLWVADTGNHALRAVDLATGHVRTAAGTGVRAFTAAERAAGALASPWDVAVLARGAGSARRERVVVAMAGTHQLALFDPVDGRARPIAGGRGEDVRDGPPLEALFAQPMAVCTDGTRVWSADAESSAVRELALAGAGAVRTLVGTGLFDFGDADGAGDAVRLQHPQGLAPRRRRPARRRRHVQRRAQAVRPGHARRDDARPRAARADRGGRRRRARPRRGDGAHASPSCGDGEVAWSGRSYGLSGCGDRMWRAGRDVTRRAG
jgi:hypothetical protein